MEEQTNLLGAGPEEQLRLLKEWKEIAEKDLDHHKELVDYQIQRKQKVEAIAAKKLKPILRKISIFQQFVDACQNKVNKINEEIDKIEKNTEL